MKAKQLPSPRASERITGGQIIFGTDFSVHASEALSAAGAIATRLRVPLVLVPVLDASAFTEPNGKVLGQLRSRLAHPSVSRAVLHHAPMNVAAVPASFGASASTAPIPEFHRVLVATDFSERGNHAIPLAYSVLACGGTVQLIHVVPPFGVAGPLVPHYQSKPRTKKDYAKLAGKLTARLRSLIPQEATERGIRSDAAVLEGRDTAKTICQWAERFGADLICVGSHGHSGLAAAVLGSVAQKVVARSLKPVLVVRMPLP